MGFRVPHRSSMKPFARIAANGRLLFVLPAAIRGQIAGSMIVSFPAPSFCHNCGEAYPWTARSLTAARELAEELENLGTEEKQILSKSLDDLVRDTPKTSVALVRFNNITRKAGGLAAEQLKSTLREIATESVKRALFPGV